jgi:hypothetical protein
LHFNLTRAIGVIAVPLLGSALAVGATALPAHATTTWSDTALSAGTVTPVAYGGTALTAANNVATTEINLSGTGVTAWSLHLPSQPNVAVSATVSGAATISYSGSGTGSYAIVVDATDSAGNVEALQIPITLGSGTIQITPLGVVKTDSVSGVTATTTNGIVTFSGAVSSESDDVTYAEPNLPSGLTSANPLTYVGGTAAQGVYNLTKVTATDADGAMQTGTFTLAVTATGTGGGTIGTAGDEVNQFGNGFDVYQQHQSPGTVIAGWPATQADPATHFLLEAGSRAGALRFEYAPDGKGTGLCVSDPNGGWASDPLPDGLILAWCNTGPFQQFVPQSNGTLKNLDTGLYINPAGKGAQLRDASTLTSWGGSSYTWTVYNNLPG